MPLTQTRRFGTLEYADSSILTFTSGPHGFEDHTRFAIVEHPDLAPVVFLQSLSHAELCFLAAPVSALLSGYRLAINPEDLERLGLNPLHPPPAAPEVLCLALLCAPENGPVTANLSAPVVVNCRTRAAVQAVRSDALYSHQHPIPREPSC